MAHQLTQPAEQNGLVARYAAEHRRSLEASRPDLYQAMKAQGTLDAHCRSVGESAATLYDALTEASHREAAPLQSFEAKLSILDSARVQADSQVMREVVLVPEAPEAPEADSPPA